jgi:farnesyl-diphosphate farnesyltransferase
LYNELIKKAQERAAEERRAAFMADLRARGIIKDRSPEEQKEYEEKSLEAMAKAEAEGFPWLLVVGIVVGVVALMVAIGGAITWVILHYFADVGLVLSVRVWGRG